MTPAEHSAFIAEAFSDFTKFCGLLDIVPKDGRRSKLTLNNIQRIYCAERTARDVILKPRRVGMTTLEQARDVFHFLTVPGARVILTCQSISDAAPPEKALSKAFEAMFEGLEKCGVNLDFKSRSAMEWVLGGRRDASLRIMKAGASQAAAEKKGRAGTVSRLHISEAAFYEYAGDTMNALLECVPDVKHGSEIVFESTPNGAHGYFYDQCQKAMRGEGGYQFHFFPWCESEDHATDLLPGEVVQAHSKMEQGFVENLVQRVGRTKVTGVTAEQLKWYQQKLATKRGQDEMDQEYAADPESCFVVSGGCFFDLSIIRALLDSAPAQPSTKERDDEALCIWEEPKRGSLYVIGADTSEGVGGDPSGAIVLERGTGAHVATLWGQMQPWDMAKRLSKLGRHFNHATIAVERNNHGHAVLQALTREERYQNVFTDADGRYGWVTSAVSRPRMLDQIEDALRKSVFVTPDKELLKEMRNFVVSESGKSEAAKGAHDDLVISTAIAWAIVTRPMQNRVLTNLPRQ